MGILTLLFGYRGTIRFHGLTEDGTPLQDKGWVTKRFNQLKAQGWTIVPANPCTH